MSRRTRYQQGSVQREKRRSGPDVWIFRWYETGIDGKSKYRKAIVGTVTTLAMRHLLSKQRKRCALTQTNKPRRQNQGRARLPHSLHTTV